MKFEDIENELTELNKIISSKKELEKLETEKKNKIKDFLIANKIDDISIKDHTDKIWSIKKQKKSSESIKDMALVKSKFTEEEQNLIFEKKESEFYTFR